MHTIDRASWREISFGERWALTCINMILMWLKPDERVSVSMSIFGVALLQSVHRESELDAVMETLRMQLHADMRETAR
jgi:hypothetical protein